MLFLDALEHPGRCCCHVVQVIQGNATHVMKPSAALTIPPLCTVQANCWRRCKRRRGSCSRGCRLAACISSRHGASSWANCCANCSLASWARSVSLSELCACARGLGCVQKPASAKVAVTSCRLASDPSSKVPGPNLLWPCICMCERRLSACVRSACEWSPAAESSSAHGPDPPLASLPARGPCRSAPPRQGRLRLRLLRAGGGPAAALRHVQGCGLLRPRVPGQGEF